jgi:hypothetical protein
MVKTTDKQFQLFKRECTKWINTFGLKNWDFSFCHAKTDKAAATCEMNYDQHAAIIRFCKFGEDDDDLCDQTIKRYAFHEIMHVFLGKLYYLAGSRFISEAEIDEEVHSLIRTLENVIL